MKKNDLLFILTSSCIVIAAWILFNIYHAFTTSTISQSIIEETQPINPSFNTKSIDQLAQRIQVTPSYNLGNATQSSIIAQPTATPSVTPKIGITPTVTPSSTVSAQITP